jgi:gp45 sliding clamp, C terminal
MKLSDRTISVLKNFSSINPSIAFKQGNVISTVSPVKNILADSTVEETFPQDFCIYDLNNFLSLVSLFKDGADLEFDENHVLIIGMGGRSKIKYRFTNPSMIVAAPDKRPNLPSTDVTFTLTEKDFTWLIRTAHVLGSPNVAIESDGNEVKLITFDITDDSAHSNSLSLENVDPKGHAFKLIFKTENLKIIPGEYIVEICSKGISKFSDNNNGLTYFITLETSSTYN